MADIDRLCAYVESKRCVSVKVRSYELRLPYLSASTQLTDISNLSVSRADKITEDKGQCSQDVKLCIK